MTSVDISGTAGGLFALLSGGNRKDHIRLNASQNTVKYVKKVQVLEEP